MTTDTHASGHIPNVEAFAAAIPRVSAFQFCFQNESGQDEAVSWTKPAFVNAATHEVASRRQLFDAALRLASGLRATLASGGQGLNRGDVVLLLSSHDIHYPTVVFGALAAGTPIACSSAAQTEKELAHQLRLVRPKHYFVQPALLKVFIDAATVVGLDLSGLRTRITLLCGAGDVPKELANQGLATLSHLVDRPHRFAPVNFDEEQAYQTAMIFFSSGTTSSPKAVQISHLNLNASCEALKAGKVICEDDTVLNPVPPFHIAGGVTLTIAPTYIGSTVVFMEKFELPLYLASLQMYKITTAASVPRIIAMLATDPLIPSYDLRHLKRLLVAGSATPPSIIRSCVHRLRSLPGASQDFTVTQGYGSTETTCFTHFMPIERSHKVGSVGPLLPGVRARVVDDDGNNASLGQQGEIWIKGPMVMRGYIGATESNLAALTSDGWYRTGDIATVDEEGFFYIVDRKKELIKVYTFQVPPAEIEAVLSEHPDIADVGVIGVPYPDQLTELPRAYVIPRSPSHLRDPTFPAQIQKWIKGKVAYYKELRGGVVCIESLPRNASGKLLRRELREGARQADAAVPKL